MNTMIINPMVVQIKQNDLEVISPIDPTMHKGGLGRILAVAAAIAIPIAAPGIAASMGMSGAIASATGWSAAAGGGAYIAGGVITGAAMGAITAVVQGQNVGRGALVGGIGGGIGGWAQGPSAPSAAEGVATTPNVAPATTPITVGAGTSTVTLDPSAVSALQQVAGGSANASAAIARKSLTGILSDTGSKVAERFKSPDALASVTMEIASQLAGEALVPEGSMPELPPEMQELYDARREELVALKSLDMEKYNQQIAISQQYLVNAGYLDPVYYGNQAANEVLINRNRQERERLRTSALTDWRTDTSADERRANIQTQNARQAAFDQQFMKTAGLQKQNLQAGLTALPDSPTGYSQGLREQFSDFGAGLKNVYGNPSGEAEQAKEGITQGIGKVTEAMFPGLKKPDEDKDGTKYSTKLANAGVST
tara:strand:+ start:1516 stop:2793 length:1278 start_codon:yes stop_codon:yes gene_type:complete